MDVLPGEKIATVAVEESLGSVHGNQWWKHFCFWKEMFLWIIGMKEASGGVASWLSLGVSRHSLRTDADSPSTVVNKGNLEGHVSQTVSL